MTNVLWNQNAFIPLKAKGCEEATVIDLLWLHVQKLAVSESVSREGHNEPRFFVPVRIKFDTFRPENVNFNRNYSTYTKDCLMELGNKLVKIRFQKCKYLLALEHANFSILIVKLFATAGSQET